MNHNHHGTLHIRVGPMFSGKTTWLNGELTHLADKGLSVLKIVHSDDNRSDVASSTDKGSTHNSSYRYLSEKIDVVKKSKLKGIDVSNYHVVGIDESQFFDDLLEVVTGWLENLGKHIRVAGLDGDAFKNKFGHTLDLVPICDNIEKLHASCKICLGELEKLDFRGNLLSVTAPFTRKLTDDKNQKDIGGSDKFIPVCRYHHSNTPEN